MTELSTSRPPLPQSWVSEIFKRMQGRYGSVWMGKWATGEKTATGDAGVENALATWADELSGFFDKPECIKYALEMWNGAFPPSLPEFRELCRDYGRRKQQETLKLSHKLTPEEREQQKAMADKIAGAVKKPEAFDDLAWAKKPRSHHAAASIYAEGKAGNAVMQEIFAGHVASGVMEINGKLLKRWDGVQEVRA
jgi:hypothetical protein